MRLLIALTAATTILCLTWAGNAGGGDAKGKDPAKRDLDLLQGNWNATAVTYNGKDFLAESKAGLRFVFKGAEATVEASEAVKKEYAKIKIKIDPGTMPPIMDITVSAGTQLDAVIEGIYELKKDELRICARVLGNDRPTEFASPAGTSIVLLVLKRATP
jgi:uncharacterized protein (TIGR03067 family)